MSRISVRDRIYAASSIDELAKIWREMRRGFRTGRLDPADKTMHDWSLAVSQRITQFVREAPTGEDATYVFNVVMRWSSTMEQQRRLFALVEQRCRELPNRAERWRQQGIIIEGITS